MIGTHTSKKRRNVPHVYRVGPGGAHLWVCEHGIHCAHGKSNIDARNWFRAIYGY